MDAGSSPGDAGRTGSAAGDARHRDRADHAAAGVCSGLSDCHRHSGVGDCTDGVPVPDTAGGIHLVPHHPVAADVVPPGAERLQFAPDSDQRNTGTSAAGEVIGAFGSFVVGGNYVIGAVIFLVLIAIQYVVINHGAVRISEVTARFTLDALPGKQMSIDSDLNAGLIDETEDKRRRKALATEAEFYGAMDGASRFTQRDAMASILITSINIVAGFLIGVFQHGMDLRKAIETYTVLTIGDGLVTVIPALMISISGALIVTRASSEARLGAEFHKQ